MTRPQVSEPEALAQQVMNKLLALDQSSLTTGWSTWEDDKLIDYGHFTVSGADVGTRLVKIYDKVSELIQKYEITEVAFEDIQMQATNVKTHKVLAEVIGLLEYYFTDINMPYQIIPAVSWRSGLKIKGTKRAEQKKNTQEYVLNTYGVSATEDESDAISIGAYVIKQKNSAFNWD